MGPLTGGQPLLRWIVCCEVFTDPTVDCKCSPSKKGLTETRKTSLSLQVTLGHQDGPQGRPRATRSFRGFHFHFSVLAALRSRM